MFSTPCPTPPASPMMRIGTTYQAGAKATRSWTYDAAERAEGRRRERAEQRRREQPEEHAARRRAEHAGVAVVARDPAAVVAEAGRVRQRAGGRDRHDQHPRRPEAAEQVAAAGVAGVERSGERDDAGEQQHADHGHDELLERDDGRVAVERDDGDLDGDQCVADGERAVAGRGADQPVGGGDERVTRGPDRDRGVREREHERQRGADEAAAHAEVRAARHGVVGAGPRAEQRHRRGDRACRSPARRGSR